jgi:transposase-like protein
MTKKNPYKKWTKLSKYKTEQIIKCFALDLTANKTAEVLSIERKTINRWYNYIREAIYWYCEKEKIEVFRWEIELDESYFWPSRIRWKRWRWAWQKIKVFGLLKRNWKVYTQIVPNCKTDSLLPIIRGKVDKESIINTDWWKAYDWLVDLWYKKHYRIYHWNNEFARWKQHINWIESFWSFTKRRLAKFNGIKSNKFSLYLKECEFRFNCWLQKKDLYNELKKLLKIYSNFI